LEWKACGVTSLGSGSASSRAFHTAGPDTANANASDFPSGLGSNSRGNTVETIQETMRKYPVVD